MKKKLTVLAAACSIALASCESGKPKENTAQGAALEAADFLKKYNEAYTKAAYVSSEAEWRANTYIVEGDSSASLAVRAANEKYAAFAGSAENIAKATELLGKSAELDPMQIRQLKAVLYKAAANPQTIASSVAHKIELESRQGQALYGFDYKVGGKSVSTNQMDEMLAGEIDVKKRKEVWEASKEVGKTLKTGLSKLQKARNTTVQALGYPDYFSYQVSDYGMQKDEMLGLTRKLIAEIWPLYRELHTYARYELALKYQQPVPEQLPAHWLPNRWGQDWADLVKVQGLDFDSALVKKGPEWLVKQAESFYVSLGFNALPASFYEKSSLYPVPDGAGYKKNNHASAWHLDLDKDIRCLMSVEPNSRWYETTHHELGHIYYYMSYTNPDVPPLLREGANRAFHEGVGSLMGLAAMQKPFLANLGLVNPDTKTDMQRALLKEALSYVVFMPFAAGVMAEFEHDLYANNLPETEYNKRWWELTKRYQGITPPAERGEEYCDASTKTHINDDAAQYYDYALSYVILFQLHDHISKNILKQDPRATNYYGNKEVGAFLQGILYPGATRDWRELLKEKTGQELSAKAMLDYFAPLNAYLKDLNKGRVHTLPEKFQ